MFKATAMLIGLSLAMSAQASDDREQSPANEVKVLNSEEVAVDFNITSDVPRPKIWMRLATDSTMSNSCPLKKMYLTAVSGESKAVNIDDRTISLEIEPSYSYGGLWKTKVVIFASNSLGHSEYEGCKMKVEISGDSKFSSQVERVITLTDIPTRLYFLSFNAPR